MNNDLISRKALLDRIEKDAPWWWQNFHSYLIVDMLKEAPAIEAEPVRHGKWQLNPNGIYDNNTWVCSVCGEPWMLIDGSPEENFMHYCPQCGARMDGGTDDDYRHDHQYIQPHESRRRCPPCVSAQMTDPFAMNVYFALTTLKSGAT